MKEEDPISKGEEILKSLLLFLHVITPRDFSIVSQIAPVQPMDEGKEKGIVYFKRIVREGKE